jgi:hypothetical protein
MHSTLKVILIFCFDYEDVYYEYALQDQTINQHLYLWVLWCLCDAVHLKKLQK